MSTAAHLQGVAVAVGAMDQDQGKVLCGRSGPQGSAACLAVPSGRGFVSD